MVSKILYVADPRMLLCLQGTCAKMNLFSVFLREPAPRIHTVRTNGELACAYQEVIDASGGRTGGESLPRFVWVAMYLFVFLALFDVRQGGNRRFEIMPECSGIDSYLAQFFFQSFHNPVFLSLIGSFLPPANLCRILLFFEPQEQIHNRKLVVWRISMYRSISTDCRTCYSSFFRCKVKMTLCPELAYRCIKDKDLRSKLWE